MKYIISINHNSSDLTFEYLLENIKIETDATFIIVDNSLSSDSINLKKLISSSIELNKCTKTGLKKVELLILDKNLGFSHANNCGLSKIKPVVKESDMIIFLNNDAKLLSKIPTYEPSDVNNRLIGAQLLTGKPRRIQTMGGTSRITPLSFGKNLLENEKEIDLTSRFLDVEGYVNGAFMMFSGHTYFKLGNMSEDYFMWCEEVDYCLAAKSIGIKLCCDPAIKVYHNIGGSSAKDKRKYFLGRASTRNSYDRFVIRGYYHFRNTLIVMKKYFPRLYLISVIYQFYVLLKRVMAVLAYDDMKVKRTTTLFKGFFDGLKGVKGKNEKI